MTVTLRGGPIVDNKLVASLCEILGFAAVPNLLWGNYLLTVYGVPTIINDVGFVIPDDKIGTASSALEGAGYVLCPEGVNCPFVYGCLAPIPSEHFHINQDMIISLYRKSEMLWRLENFDSSGLNDSEDMISASDLRLPPSVLGRGRWTVLARFFVR
ncbi:uncharacterized protein N7477_003654 [Penicillium maclennaniae]|uniref:uncharacterized protein n=1 Tax=Penicillium maclennaniae TaxID=1343394 RepID=UPI002540AFE8|nr:uncharacterized protein N7477_003654 [Penicillium maclennaniae]KAJ5678021.1 hypothetical protein N7477_003654 [Penicillium maclennaniae]